MSRKSPRRNITPKRIQLTKALVWYWLNRHPAEAPLAETYSFSDYEDYPRQDASVVTEDGWAVSGCAIDTLVCDIDPINWHDVNLVVFDWCADLSGIEKRIVFQYLKAIKGEPIDRWAKKYVGLPAPDWTGLCERFLARDLIQ